MLLRELVVAFVFIIFRQYVGRAVPVEDRPHAYLPTMSEAMLVEQRETQTEHLDPGTVGFAPLWKITKRHPSHFILHKTVVGGAEHFPVKSDPQTLPLKGSPTNNSLSHHLFVSIFLLFLHIRIRGYEK